MDDRPHVLFLCVHNAGRSQMALGWFRHLAGDRAVAWSGGSEPADEVNRVAVEAMGEVGIDIAAELPRRWTDELVGAADVVITMGCGDSCPYVPGKRYEDWALDDPAGQGLPFVRTVRDEIERHVRELLLGLGVRPNSPALPIACALSPEQVADRVAEWNEVLADVVDRVAIPDGVRLSFGSTSIVTVADLVAREHECCPFVAFAIGLSRGQLSLDVTGPPDARPVIDDLFGSSEPP